MNKNRYYDPFENINLDDINVQKKSEVLSSKSVNSNFNQRVYLYRIDNKSTNKTFVNGREIEPGKLVSIVNGDEIKLANVRLKLIIE